MRGCPTTAIGPIWVQVEVGPLEGDAFDARGRRVQELPGQVRQGAGGDLVSDHGGSRPAGSRPPQLAQ
jgi:hypothetical protein